jgi:predicted dehydrogenase
MNSDNTIPVAVVGAGAFGRNHARMYRQLESAGLGVRLAAIVDSDPGRAATLAAEYGGAATFRSVEELVASGVARAASVAVPTAHHLQVGRALMQAGMDVLIEKPLAATLAEADELLGVAAHTGAIAQVGHLERFNPAVQATLPLLTTPMFFEVHRLSVFTPRSLDVDVVLDLMIHDLDVVLSFVPSPVKEVRAVGLPILSPKVDIANARLEFESGCVANFTASRVSTERIRKLRFFQPRQYISLDYGRQDVMVFSVGENTPGAQPSLASSQIQMIRPPIAAQEPLRAEIQSFLQAVRRRSEPAVTLADGRKALALALAIQNSITEHSHRTNLAALTSR